MNSPRKTSISLRKPGKSNASSKARMQFNTLIERLEAHRKRLSAWHDVIPRMRTRAQTELVPLENQCCQCTRELVLLFDRAHGDPSFKKTERAKISAHICEMLIALSEFEDDEELDAFYEKHCMDEDLDGNPDFDLLKKVFEQMLDGDAQPGASERAARKPTAKEAVELRLRQSVREVFRKLASTVHPDRESDPVERERKTALMQRANAAYANHDLLALLEMQFEVEQIDQAALETLDDDRIKQYNKVLTSQVEEIRHDIEELEYWVKFDLRISPSKKVTPALVDKALSEQKRSLEGTLVNLESGLREFQDFRVIKDFLRTYIIHVPVFFDGDYY
jgi:hypothetical protein